MAEPDSPRIQPELGHWPSLAEALTTIPTRSCLILLIFVIGLFLLLSGDYGLSWDVRVHEVAGSKFYEFYFNGFDVEKFRTNHPAINYGAVVDAFIKVAQDFATDPLQKLKIRVFLQALLSLSCLIPIFLISSRVVSNGLALVAAGLLAATPVFFGHAFINPKDSIAASGAVWSLWLLLYCFEDEQRRPYWAVVMLGVLLGVTASIRYVTAYLLFLAPIAAIVLPAIRRRIATSSEHVSLIVRLREQTVLHFREAVILFVTFATAYTLSMPVILTNFGVDSYLRIIRGFAHVRWGGAVLYFGHPVTGRQIPWHYVYGYLLVQLPLFYHLFLATIVGVCALWPRRIRRALSALDERARTTLILLAIAAVIPFLLILIVRPVLFDGFRHVLFIVPIILMPLYLGFVLVIMQLGGFARAVLVTIAAIFLIQSALAMRSLHPYEYTYYNPLVNPAGLFELDYWGTSFLEMAERLNDYARTHTARDEKLRVSICGPEPPLTRYLDKGKFEIVPPEAAQVRVVLNRDWCMSQLTGPWLFSVRRGNLVFAAASKG
jgi:Dolichyl-phosphate-mannose-protein mannosyltransferase